MKLEAQIKGLDEARRSTRQIIRRSENLNPALDVVGAELARMWRFAIDAGPNERWEAGASYRAQETGGITLRDRGTMQDSIRHAIVGSDAVSIGSSLSVRGTDRDVPLLAVHEFGADIYAAPGSALTIPLTTEARRRRARDWDELFLLKREDGPPLLAVAGEAEGEIDPQYILLQYVRIPARPTAPIDWDTGKLLPEADEFVRRRIGDYVVESEGFAI